MISLIQRVTEASVTIEGRRTAHIQSGMLALIGIEQTDQQTTAEQLADRLVHYRVFSDSEGRMNLDLIEAGGHILLVPQFTLVADTRKGRRPGFSHAASPDQAKPLFCHLVETVSKEVEVVQQGSFGADMQVGLVNDGPVTFWIRAA
ncbi:MAG: D-tyrosyl-tRNA(Tyr) deacylase [Granulosicoccus sp.]|nr:D-tyrosyl-tRNA(Tyr) deacylase [Granulosicoccus sp.]